MTGRAHTTPPPPPDMPENIRTFAQYEEWLTVHGQPSISKIPDGKWPRMSFGYIYLTSVFLAGVIGYSAHDLYISIYSAVCGT